MASLVIGGEALFILGHDHGPTLGAHHDLVLGVLEFGHGDDALAAPRRHEGRLVDEVHQIRAREARRAARHGAQLHVRRQGHLAHMHLQDLLAAVHIRQWDHDLPVETARTQQSGIEHVRTVGRGDDDDAFIGLEAVHLHQQLVEGLLALVIAAAKACAAMATDRVDLVNEDDAGRVLLGLFEHVAHAARAHAHEHFHEVRARDGEEGHIGLARNRPGGQGLAGARRANEQHAARNAPAKSLEFLGIAQEFDNLLQILLGLVHARHLIEGDAPMGLGQKFRLRFAKAHRLAASPLHLPGQEDPHANEGDQRQSVDQQGHQPGIAIGGRTRGDRDVLFVQRLHERGIVRRIGREGAVVGEVPRDFMASDRDLAHAALIDLGEQLTETDVRRLGALPWILEQHDEGHHQQEDDDPEGEIPEVRIHL